MFKLRKLEFFSILSTDELESELDVLTPGIRFPKPLPSAERFLFTIIIPPI